MFDPQTSGGLLVSMDPADAGAALDELKALGLPCDVVGEVTERCDYTVIVK